MMPLLAVKNSGTNKAANAVSPNTENQSIGQGRDREEHKKRQIRGLM